MKVGQGGGDISPLFFLNLRYNLKKRIYMTKYLYRYRSLNNPFIFENLEIYFAKPDELNDQMEDYMNIFWQGDEIAFKGLFKHYLYVLSSVYYDIHFRNREKKIDPNYLPVFLASDFSILVISQK